MRSNVTINIGPRFSTLSQEQCAEIHSATVHILENTGIAIHEPQAVELLHGAGAHIRDGRVTIPSVLIEKAIRSAPSTIAIFDRQGQIAMLLGDHRFYFGPSASVLCYQDLVTERRELVSSDVMLLTRLTDALPNLQFIHGGACAADYDPSVVPRVIFRQVVANTTKPITFVANDGPDLSDILDMAGIVAGGPEELAARPYTIHYAEPISPLTHYDRAVRKLLICAERRIPVIYAPMPQGGATAPATLAGILAQGNAESLSGLVIHQLCRRGAPFIYGAIPNHFEMQTMIFPYGSPELHLLCAAQTSMAHYYSLPMFGTAGCTDAKEIDAQAGAEVALSILWATLSGANLIHDVGLHVHGTTLNPDLFVLADEMIDMVKHYFRPVKTDCEGLALDVIEDVGPGGSFLDHGHTLAHFKEDWYPDLFDRTTIGAWLEQGGRNLPVRLREKTERLLKTHAPKPLSTEALKDIQELERGWLS